MSYDLNRFVEAQAIDFQTALIEIKGGKKVTHWMWYVFPQIKGLGSSWTSQHYAIQNLEEAQRFLDHPILGKNLLLISNELLKINSNNAIAIFGKPDDLKLRSSMTLFSMVPHTDSVFQKVLNKYFNGIPDAYTIEILS